MKTLKIKAVIITDGKEYFIHGASAETSAEMFKAMHPIWSMDPSAETVHFVEFEMNLPDFENIQEMKADALDHKVESDRASSYTG